MAHRGCINVDRLPLQILLRDNPEWKGTPVAVTKEEKPQSPILALNREARERGLAAGTRYASALSLVPSLRARAVSSGRVAEARDRIVRLLSAFTPDIEPCPFDTDAFWVSVDGLRSLFESESRWIEKVRAALAAEGFAASVVVGFTRFGTYAIARSRQCAIVFASRADECSLLSRSSIDILPTSPENKKHSAQTGDPYRGAVCLLARRGDNPSAGEGSRAPPSGHPLGRPPAHSAGRCKRGGTLLASS